jgi:hypothetical protein
VMWVFDHVHGACPQIQVLCDRSLLSPLESAPSWRPPCLPIRPGSSCPRLDIDCSKYVNAGQGLAGGNGDVVGGSVCSKSG